MTKKARYFSSPRFLRRDIFSSLLISLQPQSTGSQMTSAILAALGCFAYFAFAIITTYFKESLPKWAAVLVGTFLLGSIFNPMHSAFVVAIFVLSWLLGFAGAAAYKILQE